MCIIKNGRAVSRSKRGDDYEEEVAAAAARRFAAHIIYWVHSGGKAQCCHNMIWKSERRRLNGSLARTHRQALTRTRPQPPPPPPLPPHVQYYTQCVLFISTSGHFFLIRHLPASGVFIIYRKVITYTRLQGSHPAHGLLLQNRLHATGPWASRWRLLISTTADKPDRCKVQADLPALAPRYFSSLPLFSYICRVKHPPAPLEGSQTV